MSLTEVDCEAKLKAARTEANASKREHIETLQTLIKEVTYIEEANEGLTAGTVL